MQFEDLSIDEQVYVMLEQVIDPELGIDIVSLGLVYEVTVTDRHCHILMTLTSPGCPLADVIEETIIMNVSAIKDIDSVEVEITFTPPWSTDNLSRYARIALGLM